MCLAHLHPKTNICAKFHENRSKTEEVVRDARLRPPARQTDRPTNDTLIPKKKLMRGYNYTLRVCGGITISIYRSTMYILGIMAERSSSNERKWFEIPVVAPKSLGTAEADPGFSLEGGGTRLCAHMHITGADRTHFRQGSRAHLRALEALGLF